MGVGAVAAAIDELNEVELGALSRAELGELVVEVHRLEARLAAARTRVLSAWDASQGWQEGGARAAASWLALKTRIPKPVAHAEVRLARRLRTMPVTAAAFAAGDIGEHHAGRLARANRPEVSEAFAEDEEKLVERAREGAYRWFAASMRYWEDDADPDRAEENAAAQEKRRRFHLSPSFEGMWFFEGVFDPIRGAEFAAALKGKEQELFEADWKAAREANGGADPTVDRLARTPAQRRLDALFELVVAGTAAPPGARKPDPLVTVLCGHDRLANVCELADGTVITPGQLAALLTRADIERVVFAGPSRVIDVGVAQRLYTGAVRRAVEVRDRECTHPLCDVPAADCQVDHRWRWADGGRTTQANGRLLCGFHNRQRERRPGP